tara:strand:+ start:1106 stop:1498 length:393 start_codon:yes stop_codon:yes gene_type:complete
MNGMNIEMQVKKAVLEKSLPKDLLDEIEHKLDVQQECIEIDSEGWGTTELDYSLAFKDTWELAEWNIEEKVMKKMLNQIKDFLIDIGYYISHPHPDWKNWVSTSSQRNKKVVGAEFKYKNQYWQTWEEGL